MTKDEIVEKLGSIGIKTGNAYPKSSFPYEGEICVGLYEREMKDDFYFFNKFDKKIYKWNKASKELYDFEKESDKYMIPLSCCVVAWEDKPFVELPDLQFSGMTLRHYACIHLRIPDSGLDWLDTLIKQTSPL